MAPSQSTSQPKRAVLYARVSELVEGRKSVNDQLAELRAWAKRDGWQVIAEHRDDGISASRYARPTKPRDGWPKVMELITTGAVDVLAVWELSRASRDRSVWASLLAAAERHGVLIAASGKMHDPVDPDDGFMVDLGAALSSRESAMVSKRVRRAVRARAAAGEPHGKLPYGYRFERDPDTGRVLRRVPHEETAPIVREICVRVLAGDALFTVATDLRRRGLLSPRGAQWRPEQVRRIALSPTYAGLRTFKGDVTASATWPALISETDHRALVAKLTDPRRKTWVDGSVKHLLVGLATCGVCDAPCRRIKNRGTPSYACSHGFHVARQQAAVDAFVTETIIARLSQPDALDLFAAEHDPHIAAALEQARDLHARLEGFYEEAAAGRLTPGGLARIESRLLGEIAIAERRARPCLPSAITDLAGPDVAERWAALSVPQRREVVRALMVPVIHKAPREGRRLFNPDLIQIRWITVR